MKTIFEHIEYVKGQPHHIRKRVVFGLAGGITAIIAFVWLAGSLATGAFAIRGSSAGAAAAPEANGSSDTSGLAGAAAALPSVSADAPARIDIIDAAPLTRSNKQAEQTTLPF
ncbi:MAG: hypothetical protein PHD04_02770 [Candidatus Pacebacteria bacterium]|nr:hypothetical protein [Candidatus Paceibacterota bacterium]